MSRNKFVAPENPFVLTASGVVHVYHCASLLTAKDAAPWTKETQGERDRRCMRCFPAIHWGPRA